MQYKDLKDTFFVVEATDFELFTLWREWNKAIPIEQDCVGFVETVGKVAGRPVCVTLFRYRFWDKWVVFWEATSQLVDHKMVREWIEKEVLIHCPKWDNGTRISQTNAWNFHHCVRALEEATGQKRKNLRD